jgi:hypothetical protein
MMVSDNKEVAMQIAKLTEKKSQRVKVRVPARLVGKLGTLAIGTVQRLHRSGPRSTKVVVKIPRRGEFEFRPQDLSLA